MIDTRELRKRGWRDQDVIETWATYPITLGWLDGALAAAACDGHEVELRGWDWRDLEREAVRTLYSDWWALGFRDPGTIQRWVDYQVGVTWTANALEAAGFSASEVEASEMTWRELELRGIQVRYRDWVRLGWCRNPAVGAAEVELLIATGCPSADAATDAANVLDLPPCEVEAIGWDWPTLEFRALDASYDRDDGNTYVPAY